MRRTSTTTTAAILAVLALMVVSGCSGTPSPAGDLAGEPRPSVIQIPPETAGLAVTAPDGRGAIRPVAPLTGCATTATDPASAQEALRKADPGATICIAGDMRGWHMRILYSGTAQAPIHIVGDGQTRVADMEVEADNVVIDGFTVLNGKSPEIQLTGNNITLRNTVARNPLSPGSDNIQLAGNNITLSRNTLGDNSGDGGNANKGGTKANCIDIFADKDQPITSHHVRIEGNRCENTALNCVRVVSPAPSQLGPDDQPSSDITVTNNYCQTRGRTAVFADNVQQMTITNNEVGPLHHAWALQNGSTGATISGNTIAAGTRYEVGMDDSSQENYHGPPVGGDP